MAVQSIIQRQFDLQEPLRMISLQHELTSADSKGDIFNIAITDGGKAADLTGMDVAAYFIRADGVTVPITGTASGNVASVTLTSACYTKPGRFALVIKVTKGSIRHAVFSCEGVVRRSSTDSLVDDADVIPSLDELLAKIGAMETATTNANTATSNANTAASSANTAADKANAAADDIENLQINASTLPAGSAATASYKDGVLTLGLPRGDKGEKGDTGSASPIKVNGVSGVDDNISITGDSVPLSAADQTALSAAVLQRDRARNLLDNSDFTNLVNQRGWSSGTQVAANAYFIDRWRSASAQSPTISQNGITASGEIYQLFSRTGLVGKTVTAAIWLSDGTVITGHGVVPADTAWLNFINANANNAHLILTNVDANMLRFRITPNGKTVRWAALYEGAYTAENLPSYQPKGYAAELMECQRYYIKYTGGGRMTGFCTTTTLYIGAPLIVPMRVTPTLTVINLGSVRVSGKNITPTGVSLGGTYGDNQVINVNYATTSGIGNYVGVWTGSYELSADYQP